MISGMPEGRVECQLGSHELAAGSHVSSELHVVGEVRTLVRVVDQARL